MRRDSDAAAAADEARCALAVVVAQGRAARVGAEERAHVVLLDLVAVLDYERRNEAKRFIILIDTFYDNAVKLIASAEAEPYAEDLWDSVTLNGIRFVMAKRCVRCVLPTIDQQTAEAGPEPLRTLSTYRRAPEGVVFGVNLAHAAPGGLAVGAPAVPAA